jgi:hypothetical protein
VKQLVHATPQAKLPNYIPEKDKRANPGLIYALTKPWSLLYFRIAEFKLGDRVVNLNNTKSIYVPFGAEGTVTAYAYDIVEVMWDEELLYGH